MLPIRRRRIAAGVLGGGDAYGPEQTLTLQPDGTDGKDVRIRSDAPTTNYDSEAYLSVGEANNVAGRVFRSLISFWASIDANIPDGSLLTSVTLSLYDGAIDQSSNARTFRVYRLKRNWVENQATWNSYSTGNSWQTAGGFGANDCEQTEIGNRNFSASETPSEFKDFVLTPTTKEDLDLGYGWLIKADTETDDLYHFFESNHTTASERPKLVIKYRAPT